jgi:hypothetical protein
MSFNKFTNETYEPFQTYKQFQTKTHNVLNNSQYSGNIQKRYEPFTFEMNDEFREFNKNNSTKLTNSFNYQNPYSYTNQSTSFDYDYTNTKSYYNEYSPEQPSNVFNNDYHYDDYHYDDYSHDSLNQTEEKIIDSSSDILKSKISELEKSTNELITSTNNLMQKKELLMKKYSFDNNNDNIFVQHSEENQINDNDNIFVQHKEEDQINDNIFVQHKEEYEEEDDKIDSDGETSEYIEYDELSCKDDYCVKKTIDNDDIFVDDISDNDNISVSYEINDNNEFVKDLDITKDNLEYDINGYIKSDISISGSEFNKMFFGVGMIKLTTKDCCHNGFMFKEGMNDDTMNFNHDKVCTKDGLYFCNIKDGFDWLSYEDKVMYWVWDVEIPDDAKVIIFRNKIKTNKFILSRRREISYFAQYVMNDLIDDVIYGDTPVNNLLKKYRVLPFKYMPEYMIQDINLGLLEIDICLIDEIANEYRTNMILENVARYHTEPEKYLSFKINSNFVNILMDRGIDIFKFNFDMTDSIVRKLIEMDISNYEKLDNKYKTMEMTKQYIEMYPNNINNVPKRFLNTYTIMKKLIQYDPVMIKFIDLNIFTLLKMIDVDYKILKYIKSEQLTQPIVRYTFIKFIENNKIIELIDLLNYIPSELISNDTYNILIKKYPKLITKIPDSRLTKDIVKICINMKTIGSIFYRGSNNNLKTILCDNIEEFVSINENILLMMLHKPEFKNVINDKIVKIALIKNYRLLYKINISAIPELFTLENRITYCKSGVPFGLILFPIRNLITKNILIELVQSRKNMIHEIPEILLDEEIIAHSLFYHKNNVNKFSSKFDRRKIFEFELKLNKLTGEHVVVGYGTIKKDIQIQKKKTISTFDKKYKLESTLINSNNSLDSIINNMINTNDKQSTSMDVDIDDDIDINIKYDLPNKKKLIVILSEFNDNDSNNDSNNESITSENESVISENESIISENESIISENESIISENESIISDDELYKKLVYTGNLIGVAGSSGSSSSSEYRNRFKSEGNNDSEINKILNNAAYDFKNIFDNDLLDKIVSNSNEILEEISGSNVGIEEIIKRSIEKTEKIFGTMSDTDKDVTYNITKKIVPSITKEFISESDKVDEDKVDEDKVDDDESITDEILERSIYENKEFDEIEKDIINEKISELDEDSDSDDELERSIFGGDEIKEKKSLLWFF